MLCESKSGWRYHFTPGSANEEAENGNGYEGHWDMVTLRRSEQGGGEIYFDNVIIRKDGLFVLRELEGLNPENLQ